VKILHGGGAYRQRHGNGRYRCLIDDAEMKATIHKRVAVLALPQSK
jgi:hypothetical protein